MRYEIFFLTISSLLFFLFYFFLNASLQSWSNNARLYSNIKFLSKENLIALHHFISKHGIFFFFSSKWNFNPLFILGLINCHSFEFLWIMMLLISFLCKFISTEYIMIMRYQIYFMIQLVNSSQLIMFILLYICVHSGVNLYEFCCFITYSFHSCVKKKCSF